MKKIFILLSLLACIVPQISHAQVDQRCWTEDACYDARKSLFGQATPEKGKPGWEKVFRQDDTTEKLCGLRQDAVGTKVGFCLPATTAKIKISIGGQNEFAGLGEFVAFIYKYGMGIAGILSVLMIIFAGVQWIVSAGSSEAISSAKHRITGAVIGLIILATAYTILYTINPDLVNLRPPNAWMINTQKISAPYCSQITKGQISKDPSNDTGKTLTTKEKQDGFSAAVKAASWAPTSTAKCGSDYYVQSTGALTCSGTFCPGDAQICYDKFATGKPACFSANIAGTIKSSDTLDNLLAGQGFTQTVVDITVKEGWAGPDWASSPAIYSVCNNGDYDNLSTTGNDPTKDYVAENVQNYYLTTTNEEIENHVKRCDSEGGFKGFVLYLNMNEAGDPIREPHFIGRTSEGTGIDLGDKHKAKSDCVLSIIKAKYFISPDDLKKGVRRDVNAAYIKDIEKGDDDVPYGRMFEYGRRTDYFTEETSGGASPYQKCI